MTMNRLWTIGHSTRTIEEFINLLSCHKIQLLVDVRSQAGSRYCPQFNARALQNSLSSAGIDYCWFSKLGGRRRFKKDSTTNSVWRNVSFRAYADYMDTKEFQDALVELLTVASSKNTAIMCAEAVWWRCHRSMISDAVKATGWIVSHIMSDKSPDEHPYTKPAVVENGILRYA